jgi:hypothetical protein
MFLVWWVGYTWLALATASCASAMAFEKPIFYAVTASVGLVTSLSLLKAYTGVDIPYLNEVGRASGLSTSVGTAWAVLGPFLSRSQAAIVMETLTMFLAAFALLTTRPLYRYVALTTVGLSVAFMLRTTNRSFFVSIIVASLVLLLLCRRLRLRTTPVWVLVGVLTAVILTSSSYASYVEYQRESTLQTWLRGEFSESDMVRVDLFSVALESLLDGNLFGHGPVDIPIYGEAGDPHNAFVFLLWTGGIPAVLWTVTFFVVTGRTLVASLRTPRARTAVLYIVTVVAAFAGGIGHNSLNDRSLWIFLGLFMACATENRARAAAPHP